MLRKEIEKSLAEIEHLLALERLIQGKKGYQKKLKELNGQIQKIVDRIF